MKRNKDSRLLEIFPIFFKKSTLHMLGYACSNAPFNISQFLGPNSSTIFYKLRNFINNSVSEQVPSDTRMQYDHRRRLNSHDAVTIKNKMKMLQISLLFMQKLQTFCCHNLKKASCEQSKLMKWNIFSTHVERG